MNDLAASDLEHVDPKTLVSWARNPRDNEAAVGPVARSIERFGFGAPVVARPSDRRVLAGHTRVKAAVLLGLATVPVRWLELADGEADAFALADNRLGEIAEWNPGELAVILADLRTEEVDLARLGWSDVELDALLSAPSISAPIAETDDDELDEAAVSGLPPVPEDAAKAPFPWFGGKRRVAGAVWAALGDVNLYVEPFAGSLACLLARPREHVYDLATVTDADGYVANFWRALKAAPAEVAEHADGPINEVDMLARHRWLVSTGRERLAALEADPEYYDARVAGWWCWGLAAWIGSGWCAAEATWDSARADGTGRGINRGKLPDVGDAGRGVHRQLPHVGNSGRGVHRQLPQVGAAGRGVPRQRPHVSRSGQGVHRKLPQVGDTGRGVHRQRPHVGEGNAGACAEHLAAVTAWFRELADRLRNVRVCCGDWSRVVTLGATGDFGSVGVLLDPPYGGEGVDRARCYGIDDLGDLSARVRTRAIELAEDPRYRIVLCGYEEEHGPHLPPTWRKIAWATTGAMQRRATAGTGRSEANRHRERLWFSPSCLPVVLPDGSAV